MNMNLKSIFLLYFFNTDILLDIEVTELNLLYKSEMLVWRGLCLRLFDLGLTFYFYLNKRVTFDHFFKLNVLDFIKH